MSTRAAAVKFRPARAIFIGGPALWFFVALAASSFLPSLIAGANSPHVIPGQILVKTRADAYEAEKPLRSRGHQVQHRATVSKLNVRVLQVPETEAGQVLADLRNDPGVEYAERDLLAEVAYVPNDPQVISGEEWHLERIHAPGAWNGTTGTAGVIVAVLDSGINRAHPDFNLILPGYDFVSGDSDPADDFGHGTAVAGVIAAGGNNGIGVAGVAFGCSLLPVKVVDRSGFASYSAIAQGIMYAVDQGARVINISIAGTSPSATLQQAVDYAWSNNVVIVAAAGNTGTSALNYPAACDHVLSVSATSPDDSLAAFSSYGSWVTLSAPGDGIWTTQRDLTNPYGSWRGTSFASPIVAGLAALVLSAEPSLANADVVSILEQTADDLGVPGSNSSFGAGRVNAFRALASILPGIADDTSLGTGSVPSSPATNQPPAISDTIPPLVRVTVGPASGARVYSSILTLGGTARDNAGLDHVEIELNDGTLQAATGTGQWMAQVPLVPGTNYLKVRAIDLAGNVSLEIRRKVFYVVATPLKVAVNGLGKVVANLDGALLEIGRSYVVSAVPESDQAFAGWTGIEPQTAVLRFVMQPGLELTANFVPSPFPAVKGSYAGLVTNPNGVLPDNSGYFTLTVGASGQFTGKVLLGGARYPFSGAFDLTGEATVQVRSTVSWGLRLRIDLAGGETVTGSLSAGAWVSDITASRNTFSAVKNPAQQAGVRPFELHQADSLNTAAGNGSGRIFRSGVTLVKGRLADNRAFGTASSLGRAGNFPFFVSRSRGTEIIIGWLSFPAGVEQATAGTVYWVRSGTNAVATALQAASAGQ